MRLTGDLLIRNVEIGAETGFDVLIKQGFISEIGRNLRATSPLLEGHGGALIPGLHDHHIHLLALAAHRTSIKVGPSTAKSPAQFETVLRETARKAAPGTFLRATDYHESVAGPLTRDVLDRVMPDHPLRVQYRTGSLWVLNSAALDLVLPGENLPACVERDAQGKPTGRIWRGDEWLRSRIVSPLPPLVPLGAELARYGITGLTDTSANTGPDQIALFADAIRGGALPQKLTLMSAGEIPYSPNGLYDVGCVKIILDEARLGDLAPMLQTIAQARIWNRNVAVHCVSAMELTFAVAAFSEAGSRYGDRIEHGGVIYDSMVGMLAELGLTVVTQPGFIAERGDIYLDDVDPDDLPSLYRCASLLRGGIQLAGSSDAPYTSPDPWAAMRAAIERQTEDGRIIGRDERLTPLEALRLFLGTPSNPGGPDRRVAIGERADLCLLHLPLAEALPSPDKKNVAATIIDGRVI